MHVCPCGRTPAPCSVCKQVYRGPLATRRPLPPSLGGARAQLGHSVEPPSHVAFVNKASLRQPSLDSAKLSRKLPVWDAFGLCGEKPSTRVEMAGRRDRSRSCLCL